MAATAAGNEQTGGGAKAEFVGVAPEVDLIVVKLLDTPREIRDVDGNEVQFNFRFQDAVIYILRIAIWLARALGQGASFTADLDTDGVGVRMPESITTDLAVQGAGLALADAGGLITEAATALEAAQQSGDESALISAIVQLAEGLITFFDALRSMVSVIDSLTGSIPDAAERQAIEDFVAVLARRMADYLILSVLELRQPRFTFLLKLLGLIEWESIDADPAKPLSQSYVKKTIQLQRLKDLITDPGQHASTPSNGVRAILTQVRSLERPPGFIRRRLPSTWASWPVSPFSGGVSFVGAGILP